MTDFDPPYYGGPPEDDSSVAYLLQQLKAAAVISTPMSVEAIKRFQLEYARQLGFVGRQAHQAVLDEMNNVRNAVEAQMQSVQPLVDTLIENKREKGRGKVRNHGPRPDTTFDRRGRRRY